MHRSNLRMLMDKQLKQLFWKNKGEGDLDAGLAA